VKKIFTGCAMGFRGIQVDEAVAIERDHHKSNDVISKTGNAAEQILHFLATPRRSPTQSKTRPGALNSKDKQVPNRWCSRHFPYHIDCWPTSLHQFHL
jgi:hypothetical protein